MVNHSAQKLKHKLSQKSAMTLASDANRDTSNNTIRIVEESDSEPEEGVESEYFDVGSQFSSGNTNPNGAAEDVSPAAQLRPPKSKYHFSPSTNTAPAVADLPFAQQIISYEGGTPTREPSLRTPPSSAATARMAAYQHHINTTSGAYPRAQGDDTSFLSPRAVPATPPKDSPNEQNKPTVEHDNDLRSSSKRVDMACPDESAELIDVESQRPHLQTSTSSKHVSTSTRLRHKHSYINGDPHNDIETGYYDGPATPEAPAIDPRTSEERLRELTNDHRSLPVQFVFFLAELLRKFGRTIVEGFKQNRSDERVRTMSLEEYQGTRESLAYRWDRHVSGPREREEVRANGMKVKQRKGKDGVRGEAGMDLGAV